LFSGNWSVKEEPGYLTLPLECSAAPLLAEVLALLGPDPEEQAQGSRFSNCARVLFSLTVVLWILTVIIVNLRVRVRVRVRVIIVNHTTLTLKAWQLGATPHQLPLH
jgi:hypothetical protein